MENRKEVIEKIKKQGYIPLHRHSEYSLLDGAIRIEDMVARTPFIGALTDHGNMFGFLKYYRAMKDRGKIPIIGMEAYAKGKGGENKRYHLIILCKNNEGYKNLIKLTSKSYEEKNFYRKPQILWEDLKENKNGLIILSACLGGEIPRTILDKGYEKALKRARDFKEVFGEDFYLEIQRHGLPEEKIVNPALIKIGRELNIKVVATSDAHYLNKEDKKTHEILLAMQTKTTIKDPNRFKMRGTGYHLHTKEEMEELFKDMPEVVSNSVEVACKCLDLKIDLGHVKMPYFEIPKGLTEYDYFRNLIYRGLLNHKISPKNTIYIERIKKELKVIKDMGFIGYFLIVADFVNYAKDHGILVGPGRGSAGGSLICYLLNITEIDPIRHDLYFERFLNPDRVSMPDIDIDFPDDKRDEVIDYVKRKYGADKVSNIVTFGTLGAKMVIRDVARTLGYPYSYGDRIAKQISDKPKVTLKDSMEDKAFSDLIKSDKVNEEIYKYALKLEGLPRHASQHACGVIISSDPISQVLPEANVGPKNNKARVTQVTMTECEDLGLLKMDFLGLRTMSLIENTLKAIKKNRGINLKFSDIPIDHKPSYSLMKKGMTAGVFQLESDGMKDFMKKLYKDLDNTYRKVEGDELFNRLTAGIALYRPGPLDYIDDYLDGMRFPEHIAYIHQSLKPILKSTYGQIVYQEQVMRIATDLAGYTMAQADNLRRAMSKKKRDVMEREEPKFIEGCINTGLSPLMVKELWSRLEKFCEYAFNRSHAVGYAYISAKTAYLKYNFKEEFMGELLNSYLGKADKISEYMQIIKEEGLKLVGPDINSSMNLYYGKDKKVFTGFAGIKNVGKTGSLIVEEREKGPYKDLNDFFIRTKDFLDKRAFEGLVYSGALDSLYNNREDLIRSFKKIKNVLNKEEDRPKNQISFFKEETLNLMDLIDKDRDLSLMDKALKEEDVLGMIFSEHPAEYIRRTQANPFCKSNRIENVKNLGPKPFVAMVKDVKRISFSNNGFVVKCNLQDETGSLKAIARFKEEDYRNTYLQDNAIITVIGRYNKTKYGDEFLIEGIPEKF